MNRPGAARVVAGIGPLLLSLLAAGVAQARPIDHSPTGARRVVLRYYAAIDRGDFAAAYRLWGDAGRRSGQSYAGFARGFAATAHSRVAAGAPTDGEGAAGSSFVTVPVRVTATLKNHRRRVFTGSYVLRRVNDVDGTTVEQRRWHLDSASLRAVR